MCALAGSRGSGGSNPAGRWGAGEVGVVRSLGPKPETGQLSSWTGWLSEGERTDGNLECALKKKILTVPQISVFRQGIGSCGVVGIPQGGSRTACGKFLRPGCWVFSPFLNFPLLKIFQAFSAEGPFALLT